ncbi:MAG: hypothetical protein EON59_02405 [Alphaproteobacteria bacterium]|nr:MAG: hypothetical protein EON59_02405 [Alphaproteobacteria bacterium]
MHWLLPDGTERRARPDAFGVIGNGHFIKLGKAPGDVTPWDQNFEGEFQAADDQFPNVISWLEGLEYEARFSQPGRDRFLPQPATDDQFVRMVQSLTSLAIRSPMTRAAAVSLAEHLRGPLPERERNSLIAANLRDMHRAAMRASERGKAAAILSPDREFIFGDGFYHNLTAVGVAASSPRILAPLTPRIAVLYAIPTSYTVEPRFSTLVIDADEAENLNQVVQIYSKDALFYRTQKPRLTEDFQAAQHKRLSSSRNVVETIIHDMPGVPDRDKSLDFLEDMLRR